MVRKFLSFLAWNFTELGNLFFSELSLNNLSWHEVNSPILLLHDVNIIEEDEIKGTEENNSFLFVRYWFRFSLTTKIRNAKAEKRNINNRWKRFIFMSHHHRLSLFLRPQYCSIIANTVQLLLEASRFFFNDLCPDRKFQPAHSVFNEFIVWYEAEC